MTPTNDGLTRILVGAIVGTDSVSVTAEEDSGCVTVSDAVW